jgi:60S ribosome subunit biogenesis protein NIP7
MRLAISVARPNLISLGTCFGKFSKSGKFKLHITALDPMAQYAKYKVRIFLAYQHGTLLILGGFTGVD